MPRKGHTEEQIIYALRQVEAGKKVGDICREMGVSQQRKLKTLVADLTLDKHILQEVLSKKV
jgi:putative transposase